ncbi:MAG: hypothetical protein J4F32_01560 [Dehalococcoidia bacterium]|nr:hypothetical protein [Dehalococcoidia bacterium]
MTHAAQSTFPRLEFWRAFSDERFVLPRCSACGAWQSYGARACAACGSGGLEWRDASGEGSVYSLMERYAQAGAERVLHVVVLQLDEGPLVMGAAYAPAGALRPGARVSALVGEAAVEGLPLFGVSPGAG